MTNTAKNLPKITIKASEQIIDKKPVVVDYEAFTKEAKKKFLEVFQEGLNIAASCRAATITFPMYQNWLDRDDEFRENLEAARKLAIANLYSIGYKRASKGAKKPLISHGKLVRDENGNIEYVREYSNALLIRYLEAYVPEFHKNNNTLTDKPTSNNTNNNIPDNFLILNPGWLRQETLELIERDVSEFQQKGIVNSDEQS